MSSPVLTERLGYLLKHAQLRLAEATAAALEPWGVDGRQWAVLEVVAAHAPLSQGDAARLLAIDRTTMVAMLDILEAKGFLERRRKPGDRRTNLVALTDDGMEALRRIRAAGHEAQREFLAPLDAELAGHLVEALRVLADQSRVPVS